MNPKPAPPVTKEPTKIMDSNHRCDRCGAQAYVSFILESGLQLLFCGNHWERNKAALEGKGFADDSALLAMREGEQNKMVGADA